jgi:hypothetical protein
MPPSHAGSPKLDRKRSISARGTHSHERAGPKLVQTALCATLQGLRYRTKLAIATRSSKRCASPFVPTSALFSYIKPRSKISRRAETM